MMNKFIEQVAIGIALTTLVVPTLLWSQGCGDTPTRGFKTAHGMTVINESEYYVDPAHIELPTEILIHRLGIGRKALEGFTIVLKPWDWMIEENVYGRGELHLGRANVGVVDPWCLPNSSLIHELLHQIIYFRHDGDYSDKNHENEAFWGTPNHRNDSLVRIATIEAIIEVCGFSYFNNNSLYGSQYVE